MTVGVCTATVEDFEDVEALPEPFIVSDEYIHVALDKRLLKETIKSALGKLTPRQRFIIEARYGIGRDRPESLDYLGNKFGVTRGRILAIEEHALRELRHSEESDKLCQFNWQ